jgi:GT2 family glycosyltransferase
MVLEAPMSTPRVSILLPVHNRAHLLDRVLGALAETTTYPDAELLAVDDRSTDGSLDVLRRWEDSGSLAGMRVLQSPGAGAVAALNTALHAASGELCIQLDDDVKVETPGWIERMLELMTVDPVVGVVTGKVVLDSGEIQACGVDVTGPAGWRERRPPPGSDVERRVAEVDSGIGCFMMYRRGDALEVGGYDPEWSPVWLDDIDLCIGIRARGRKAFYLPDVVALHYMENRRPQSPGLRPRQLARAVGRRLPPRVRSLIDSRSGLRMRAYYTSEQAERLRHHHAYWQRKWGWDPRNPDLAAIERRWGGTEICWARDPERRAAGERVIAAFEARRAAVTGA